MEEPEWVDAFQGHSVADEVWLRRQMQNGDAAKPEPKLELVTEEDSWTPRNLAELEDVPPVEPTLGSLGLVYPGKRHVFSGPQESAKTLAAYVVGLSVVRRGATVVLIDFEMGPWDAKTRLRELGASDEELGGFLYVEPDVPATGSRVAELVSLAPELVLLDAAAGAFQLEGYDDNSRKDVERWANAWVTPFWKAGIATVVLDHVTKNAETRGNYAIGSERKVGGADVHLGFSVITPIRRGTHGRYQITTHKDRGGCLKRGKLATFELSSDPETHNFTWSFVPAQEIDEEHVFRPTHLMEKVSRFLEQCVSLPVSRNTVEKEKLGKAEYVREALDVLVAEGFLEELAGPNRSRNYDVITVYREVFDTSISGSSQVRPEFVPDPGDSGSSVRPSPYRGDDDDELVPKDEVSSSQATLDEDDDIPF